MLQGQGRSRPSTRHSGQFQLSAFLHLFEGRGRYFSREHDYTNEKTTQAMIINPSAAVVTHGDQIAGALSAFVAAISTAPQQYSIDPSRHSMVIGEGGTRFNFTAQGLEDESGAPASGLVTLQLWELYSKRAMLLGMRPTFSEDRLLESAGQILLLARQNGRPLRLCRPLSVEMPLPEGSRNPLSMRLYTGATAATRPFRAERSFDWRLAEPKAVKIKKIGQRKYFAFELREFNWATCANLLARKAARVMISARPVCAVDVFDELSAYICFGDYNAAAGLFPSGSGFTIFNIPVGLRADIIMLGARQGRFYFGQTCIAKTSGRMVYVPMYPAGEIEIIERLDAIG
jgi:hypothetical protein